METKIVLILTGECQDPFCLAHNIEVATLLLRGKLQCLEVEEIIEEPEIPEEFETVH
jgi:hypothetical protein